MAPFYGWTATVYEHTVHPPPLSAEGEGGGVKPPNKFSKGRGLIEPQLLEGD